MWTRSVYYSDAPVTLMDIQCSGSEDQLIDCARSEYKNFSCSYVAIAYCEGKKESTPYSPM